MRLPIFRKRIKIVVQFTDYFAGLVDVNFFKEGVISRHEFHVGPKGEGGGGKSEMFEK